MKIHFLLTLLIISFNTNAYAYLDPGAGSSILQLLLAFLAGVGAFLSLYWSKFKLFLQKIFKKSDSSDSKK